LVLPDLIETGAICHFDFAFGEFHPHFAPIHFESVQSSSGGGPTPSPPDDDCKDDNDEIKLTEKGTKTCAKIDKEGWCGEKVKDEDDKTAAEFCTSCGCGGDPVSTLPTTTAALLLPQKIIASETEALSIAKSIFDISQASRQCTVEILGIDDESYLHDGRELPVPPT